MMSPSGRHVAFVDRKKALVILDTKTRKKRSLGTGKWNGATLQWLFNESVLAVIKVSRRARFFDVASGKEIFHFGVGHSGAASLRFAGRVGFDLKTGALSSGYPDPCSTDSACMERRRDEEEVPTDHEPVAVVAKVGSGSLPNDAEKTVRLSLIRTLAFGGGTLALWDASSGKAMTTLGGALSFQVSPSKQFVAVARDRCEKAFGCGAEVAVIDVASGAVRWRFELPAVTQWTEIFWFGTEEQELLAVLEREGHFLRPSDGAVLHAVAALTASKEVVVWTESGLVDASPNEFQGWAFRAAGQMAQVTDASEHARPGLWRDFREGRPLTNDKAAAAVTAPN
ncbi:MAG: hypothetical protein EXR75_06470 [Myxococcales bacterium]|nr:hypothetical protein [Myxococcales bacterium]